jgi:hypothetical protein
MRFAVGDDWRQQVGCDLNEAGGSYAVLDRTSQRTSCFAFASSHRPVATLDPAMVLLYPVAEIATGPMTHTCARVRSRSPSGNCRTPSAVTPASVMPATALAEWENAVAAVMSRVSLSLTSTCAPSYDAVETAPGALDFAGPLFRLRRDAVFQSMAAFVRQQIADCRICIVAAKVLPVKRRL